ncbi:MAG: hypothetical protein JST39_08315 [Bacteroidetes bacterium]|nr:hypothetical protein [Bacteroidota bacterium]
MNPLAYIIYLGITYLIPVHIGLVLYRNGRIYMLEALNNDEQLTSFVNRLLLIGYYLVNLGYAALMLRNWVTVENWTVLLLSVCRMTGRIMLGLAALHFMNMTVLYLLRKRNQPFTHHK